MTETLTYMPIKQNAVEEGKWIQMQAKVEEIKNQMGDKYILSKPVDRLEE